MTGNGRFEPGNQVARKHGATMPGVVAPIAAGIGRELPAVAPWTDRPAFAGAVASLAWTEAQIGLVRDYIDAHGPLDSKGRPTSATKLADQLETRAQRLRDSLGLTPLALARLLGQLSTVATAGGDGDGLAALKREGASILEARRLAVVPGDDDGDA